MYLCLMKSIFFALVLLCPFGIVQARAQQAQTQQTQTQPPPQTGVSASDDVDLYSSNTEKFADSAGRLIQKEFVSSGHILDCTIQVVHFTDMIKGTRRNALRFVNGQQRDTYLDEDEVSVLTLSMYAIRDKVLSTAPTNFTEAKYKSRSGFEAGCFYEKQHWQLYLQLKRHDTSTVVYMKKADFDVFLQILDNVKEKFKQQ